MAMEDSSMMSPADIAALTRGNTGFGGDGISWLVLILLFFGFMGGGWGGLAFAMMRLDTILSRSIQRL